MLPKLSFPIWNLSKSLELPNKGGGRISESKYHILALLNNRLDLARFWPSLFKLKELKTLQFTFSSGKAKQNVIERHPRK